MVCCMMDRRGRESKESSEYAGCRPAGCSACLLFLHGHYTLTPPVFSMCLIDTLYVARPLLALVRTAYIVYSRDSERPRRECVLSMSLRSLPHAHAPCRRLPISASAAVAILGHSPATGQLCIVSRIACLLRATESCSWPATSPPLPRPCTTVGCCPPVAVYSC